MTYKDKLTELMSIAAKKDNTIFVGQQLLFKGNPMSTTLDGVPKDKMIELPVMEETQMGITLGLAMTEQFVISFYPRWDFLISATNQLINHVDKYQLMANFLPHIIIRVGKGADKPLDPGHQHKGNYLDAFQLMSKSIKYYDCKTVLELDIAYKEAINNKGIYIICEYPELYQNYTTFNFIVDSEEERINVINIFQDEKWYNLKDSVIANIKDISTKQNEKFFNIPSRNIHLDTYIKTNNTLPISETIKNLLRENKNFFVIFVNENEYESTDLLSDLKIIIESENLPINQFYVINGNENLSKINSSLNNDHDKTNPGPFNTFTSRKLIYFSCLDMVNNCPEYQFEPDKKHLFMCYNRVVKPHRILTLAHLKKNNLLDVTDWSFLRGFQKVHCKLTNMMTQEAIDEMQNEINFVNNLNIKKSEYEENLIIDEFFNNSFNWGLTYSRNSYKNSYINLVTESAFEEDNLVHITEKSLIPLYYSQIPLIIATYNHKKTMKEKFNFDFFEDLVDYSYDNEVDTILRFKMIMHEILRLSTKRDDIVKFYKESKKRFLSNRQIVIDLINDKSENQFYKSMINK